MSYYNKNVLDDIDPYIKNNLLFEEWFNIVEDILMHDEFQRRKLFMHHHNMSVWEHSILVSYKSFMASKYYGGDERVCAIAGLLHDFYPQAWLWNDELAELDEGKYLSEFYDKKSLFKMHGFVHGKEAAKNYVKYFPELEDKRITNAIERHMFPLTIKPPRYFEGYILTAIDKVNSVRELPGISFFAKGFKNKAISILKKLFNKI